MVCPVSWPRGTIAGTQARSTSNPDGNTPGSPRAGTSQDWGRERPRARCADQQNCRFRRRQMLRASRPAGSSRGSLSRSESNSSVACRRSGPCNSAPAVRGPRCCVWRMLGHAKIVVNTCRHSSRSRCAGKDVRYAATTPDQVYHSRMLLCMMLRGRGAQLGCVHQTLQAQNARTRLQKAMHYYRH